MDDIQEARLPEKVKLSIASSGFERLATSKKELEQTNERERSLDILQQILPDADLRLKKKPVQEFKAVARYDPTGAFSAKLEVQPQSMEVKQEQALSGKKNKLAEGAQLEIRKGVDLHLLKKMKATERLKQASAAFAGSESERPGARLQQKKRKVVKEVKKQKWEDISQRKEELREFRLFG